MTAMQPPLAFVHDERCLWHDPGNYALMLKPGGYIEPYNQHIENPDPKRRMVNLAQVSGLLAQIEVCAGRDAAPEELLRVHSAAYVAHVQSVAQAGGGELGVGAPISSNGWEVALRSAGCALRALDLVMEGQAARAYAMTRPPGHHAEPERGMGFCVFSNAALAAAHAIARYGLQRVAIVDWDVHYGNGTDKTFANRKDVLCISIHQQAGYLQVSGEADELGEGHGVGYSLNVPLPPGCGHAAYVQAFERVVVPALDSYQPELIIVACGYDAGRFDPLGRMLLDGISFRWMTQRMMALAQQWSQGRLVMTHEGGYCPVSVPFFGLAVLEELAGVKTDVSCPFTSQHDKIPGQQLQTEQKRLIDQLARHFEDVRQRHW